MRKSLFVMAASTLLLASCREEPKVLQNKDLTGDGIADVLMRENYREVLYVGKEDDTFTRAEEGYATGIGKYYYGPSQSSNRKDWQAWVWDGKSYSPYQKLE